MSQIIKPTPAAPPPPTPFLETLSDNVGTKVNADALGNIQIEGQLNEQTGFFSTVVATTPAPGSHQLMTNPMSAARWVVDGLSTTANPNGTHTTIAAAIASALSGDTILILPKGSPYVEDLTLKAGVNLVGQVGDYGGNVTILGKATFSASGTVNFSNIRFTTNGDYFLHLTGSNPSIVNYNFCYWNCSNHTGILFDSSNAGSVIAAINGGGTLGITGISFWTSSSPGIVDIFYSNFGNAAQSTTENSSSAGIIGIQYSTFANPIKTTGTAAILGGNSAINTNSLNVTGLNIGGSTASDISYFGIASNTASAINIGAGSILNAVNTQITSANTNAITGTGTLVYDIIDFPGTSSTINSTLTLTPRNIAIGRSYASNGTVSLPSYSFISDKTSGIYYASTQVRIANSGGDVIQIGNGFANFQGIANLLALAYGINFQSVIHGTTNLVASNTLYVSCDSSGGAITLNIPTTGLTNGQKFVIKDATGSAAADNITVTTAGGTVTFDGSTSVVMNVNYGSLTIIYNSTTGNYEIN